MFLVSKIFDVCAAHKLELPYESPCNKLHGHNYMCSITVSGNELNKYGMLADFSHMKKLIHTQLDHNYINDVIPEIHPTAENLCMWIAEVIQNYLDTSSFVPHGTNVYKVVLKETDGNEVHYKPSLDKA